MIRRGIFAVLVLSACAPSLAGQLRRSGGEVVTSHEARVNITPLDAPKDGAAESIGVVVVAVDFEGHFATQDKLPKGSYLVEALVPGYVPQSKKIDLATNMTVDLTLTPIVAAKINATSANKHVGEDRGAGRATLTPPSL